MKYIFSLILLCSISAKAQVDNSLQSVELVSGLFAYTDYESGIAYAKKEHKPVLVYFRDRRSVNCLKFEKNILSDDNVKKTLIKNYVFICLLVDDNTLLSTTKKSAKTGKSIKTLGDYHIDLEMSQFKSDIQPFSASINEQNKFIKGIGFTGDPNEFLKFLRDTKS